MNVKVIIKPNNLTYEEIIENLTRLEQVVSEIESKRSGYTVTITNKEEVAEMRIKERR